MRVAQVPLNFTLAPHSDEDTSRDAAKAIAPHLERLEQRVLDALATCGLTAEQIQDVTRLMGDTVRPRLVALKHRGLVVKTSERRRTRSGRLAAVWRRACDDVAG